MFLFDPIGFLVCADIRFLEPTFTIFLFELAKVESPFSREESLAFLDYIFFIEVLDFN